MYGTFPYDWAGMSAAQLQRTLPSSWYRSTNVFKIEKERIFCREWIGVCREEELPDPGDRGRGQPMNITRRRMLVLLPAAAVAWKYVLAGTPEASPNYDMAEHWWAMLIDITKCIGCGSCVRGCQQENHVPDGYFRTWVERYHVTDYDIENPHVDSPDGGKKGFPPSKEEGGKNFFVPKLCNHCADSPCTQVCPVGATFISPDGVVLVDKKYCLGCRY